MKFMTREDALLYLPDSSKEVLEESYKQKLFKFKQRILFIHPSTSLYQLQIKKISLVYKSYIFLSKINDDEKLELDYDIYFKQEDVGGSWKKYNQNKNDIKLLLFNSNKFHEIIFFLNKLIENERKFALIFKDLIFKENYNIKVDNRFDLMELESELEKFIKSGYSSVKDFEGLDSNNILVKEAYRLSLWLKKENNV